MKITDYFIFTVIIIFMKILMNPTLKNMVPLIKLILLNNFINKNFLNIQMNYLNNSCYQFF